MKILFINDQITAFGGAETSVLGDILLTKQKHQVYTASFGLTTQASPENQVVAEPQSILLKYLFRYFYYYGYRQLKTYIQSVKPDLIHLNRIHKYPSATLLACKNQKLIQTVHDYSLVCPTNMCVLPNGKVCPGKPGLKCFQQHCLTFWQWLYLYPLFRLNDNLTKKYVTTFLAPSLELKKILSLNGFSRVVYLPYYLDLKLFRPATYSTRKKKEILYVGRLAAAKGVDYLLRALPPILNSHPEAKLLIIGDGPEKKPLEQLTKSLKLSLNVTFLGKIPHDQLPAYYQKAQVVVVPSVWKEQFGFAGIEALACNTPCVASNIGGIPEWLIDKQTGYLVKPRNSSQLAQKIIYLLDHPKLANNMGKNGRKLVEQKYSLSLHWQILNKIYRSIADVSA